MRRRMSLPDEVWGNLLIICVEQCSLKRSRESDETFVLNALETAGEWKK